MPHPERPPVALLGLGFAGARLHLPALRRLGVEPVLAADPDPETHGRAGGVPTTTDWRAVFASSARAVIIATPPETHARLAVAMLESDRHVYLEKPMACSPEQATAIVDAAAASAGVLQLGFAYRFHPLWRRLRRLVERGRLRPPLHFRARFTGAGRDPVLDLGPHHVDLAAWLLGTPPVSACSAGAGRIEVRWNDGSVLHGVYEAGTPEDRVIVTDRDRQRVELDRLHGRRLRGRPGLRGGMPVGELAVWRTLRPEWERSFQTALREFLMAAQEMRCPTGAGAQAGALTVAVSCAIARSRASGRVEPVRRA